MDVITPDDLAAYLGSNDVLSSPRADLIVSLTNGLITEKWLNPVTPATASVKIVALAAATRAWRNKPGHGPLESVTRSFDDSSRTERYAVPVGEASGHDVYLTDAELAVLNGSGSRRVGSIRLSVPRFS